MKRLCSLTFSLFIALTLSAWVKLANYYTITFVDGKSCVIKTRSLTNDWMYIPPIKEEIDYTVEFYFDNDEMYDDNLFNISLYGVEDKLVEAVKTTKYHDGYVRLQHVYKLEDNT